MKTRTKKAAKPVPKDDKPGLAKAQVLEQSVTNAPSLFILPKELTSDARIFSLPSPARSGKTSHFLICPRKGFYEFTNVSEAKACRSWLLTPEEAGASEDTGLETTEEQGYVLRRPDLLIATPFDPLFIIIPFMTARWSWQDSFLSSTDYLFDAELAGCEQLQQLLRQPGFGPLLERMESRMRAVSTWIDLGNDDDVMYRLSKEKLAEVLVSKAMHVADVGMPSTMEQHFVQQALEMPVSHTQSDEFEETPQSPTRDAVPVNDASQDSNLSGDSASSVSTAPTSNPATPEATKSAPEQIVRLLRIRTALDYMLRSYVNPTIREKLTVALQQQPLVDFKPLIQYEEAVNDLKQKAQALRTLSDNISRKRSLDDDEAAVKANEKRRKKEEEEQRKKNMSHGAKRLMKANTSGMMKLSSFFTKPAAK